MPDSWPRRKQTYLWIETRSQVETIQALVEDTTGFKPSIAQVLARAVEDFSSKAGIDPQTVTPLHLPYAKCNGLKGLKGLNKGAAK